MQKRSFQRLLATAAASAAIGLLPHAALAQAPTEISFFYPVAVGGPITKLIDEFAAEFAKENPGIKVTPIYAGSYQDTIVKALTANKAGNPPVTSVLLSTDMFTLIDEDAIVPIDNFIKTADDQAWLASFYKAFMLNSQSGGKTWGVPFQRSTVVLYYNKELFKAAGLDPNKPPASWAERSRNTACRFRRAASPTGCSKGWRSRTAWRWPTTAATPSSSTTRR
jgi:sn-glycerol 3-phosphate transport system substrate-binding protein